MDSDIFKAPNLTHEDIRLIASDFLDLYNPDCLIPVPVEDILELKLNIHIILLPGLKQGLDVEGFISGDLKKIYIDEWTFSNRVTRTRFTLAHEIGHSIMHKELYQSMKIESTEEWKHLLDCIDPREYSYFEYHAYTFAGLILVPTKELKESYCGAIDLYTSEGYDPRDLSTSSIAIDYISTYLSRKFEVSAEVVKRRIRKEGLMG